METLRHHLLHWHNQGQKLLRRMASLTKDPACYLLIPRRPETDDERYFQPSFSQGSTDGHVGREDALRRVG
jgi:hypothetical protein